MSSSLENKKRNYLKNKRLSGSHCLPLAACSTPSTRQTHKGKGTYESYSYNHSYDTEIEFRYFEHILFYLLVLAITTLLSCYVKIFATFMIV
ncbi:MAG: hypothetical protein M3297_02075 [Thermoproteota archaeon]|nr:hypothetical protein [Thermoproteota archaeon]